MELTAAVCNQCGASLSVPEMSRFVTCLHCGSQLEVKRTESVCYTELVQALGEQTERLESQLQRLNAHRELELLDREWQIRREKFGKAGKELSGAEKVAQGISSFMGIAIGFFTTIAAIGHSLPASLFFGAFTMFAVVMLVSSHNARQNYEQARMDYEFQRQALLNQARNHLD